MKNSIIFLIAVLNATILFSQETLKKINGKVMYLDTPLVNAEVSVADSDEKFKTDLQGKYSIEAKEGGRLVFHIPVCAMLK